MRIRKLLLGGLFLAAAASWSSAQQTGGGVVTGPANPPPAGSPKSPSPQPSPVPATDPEKIATLPYEALIKIAQTDADQLKDAQSYTLKITSKLGTAPDLIKLYLDRKSGRQELEVDQFGLFRVPYNQELVDENPTLVTNQPKGSLNLNVKLALDKPDWPKPVDGKVTYQALFGPMLKLNKQMKAVDPLFGEPQQQQFAIRIKAEEGGLVKITRDYGTRTLAANKQGHIWLAYEKLLFDENPSIQVPEGAEFSAIPVTPDQAIAIRSQ